MTVTSARPQGQHRVRRVTRLLVILGIAASALGLAPLGVAEATVVQPSTVVAVTADDSQPVTFGVATSGPKGPDSRTSLGYLLAPGSTVEDQIAVVNAGTSPVTLAVYAKDAINSESGAFDLLPASQKSTDVGTWIHLERRSVTVPAGSRRIVPFTLTIPATATPGDHVGGIVASLTATSKDASGNQVAIERRVGSRVYLRVTGALTPSLEVTGVTAKYHGTANPVGKGSTTVTYTVHNKGNVRLSARQTVTVGPKAVGPSVTVEPGGVVEILPGNSIVITQEVPGVLPLGAMTASVTVEPLPRPGDALGQLTPVSAAAEFWAFPWAFLACLLLLIGLSAWWLRRHRVPTRSPPPWTRQTSARPWPASRPAPSPDVDSWRSRRLAFTWEGFGRFPQP